MFNFVPTVSRPVTFPSSSVFIKLTGACFGDSVKAESLVKYEFLRDSSLIRPIAVQRAYDRLMDDRR